MDCTSTGWSRLPERPTGHPALQLETQKKPARAGFFCVDEDQPQPLSSVFFENFPYFWRNLSIRPAVSTNWAFPV